MWGGVECTVNRVGDDYFDQCERSGHAARADDLERFAALGITRLRYPVLWERTAPDGLERADWRWADERLGRLRRLGLEPIVGLLHHGSGPRSTSLLDPGFPEALAAYARAVAERYPWVTDWTPVNEPLTTARFSGLYGVWYPHGRDDRQMVRALLNQCRGVVLAMRAIRRAVPGARLVQTDDLGKTWSTPRLAYQAEHENERRWLGFDLLCGRVERGHPLHRFLLDAGASPEELAWFVQEPCPPDIIGINHYVTSERYLDERLDRFPDWSHGGNGRHRYADVEALRASPEGVAGPHEILREAWERYRLPLAVTEAHLGGTRDEQLRWLGEMWRAALDLRAEGGDVRAVTVWSLLGAYDWNILVTRINGFYESGVFDLRAAEPRPTALARMVRGLATRGRFEHPVLHTPGWWRRPDRLLYGPEPGRADRVAATRGYGVHSHSQPILITGATGTLGRAFARICDARGLEYRLLTRRQLDVADPVQVAAVLDDLRPWAVVNAAGYVRVDDAEREAALCRRENVEGPSSLAGACAARDTALVTFSSDLVFDGAARRPYVESDPTAPCGTYGASKAEGERQVLERHAGALVVRTSAFFGPWDAHNFVTLALRALAADLPFRAAADVTVSATYVPDLVHATLDLLIDGERGVWHLASPGAVTWAELARHAAERAGVPTATLDARPADELGLVAVRPCYSVLGSERGVLLAPLDDALDRYLRERDAEVFARV
jgi:dTDP-4-dehydrorhamnose reductase